MTGREPDLQRAIDDAIDRCARYLTGRILPGLDAKSLATVIVTGLYDDDWRPWPRDTRIPRAGEVDAKTTRRGATEAREALREARTRKAMKILRGEPTE